MASEIETALYLEREELRRTRAELARTKKTQAKYVGAAVSASITVGTGAMLGATEAILERHAPGIANELIEGGLALGGFGIALAVDDADGKAVANAVATGASTVAAYKSTKTGINFAYAKLKNATAEPPKK